MVRAVLAFGALLVLAACADDVPTMTWSKPGGTYDQFVADRAVCVERSRAAAKTYYINGVRYAGKPNVLDAGIFLPCMTEFGYARDTRGFAAPRGDEMPLSP